MLTLRAKCALIKLNIYKIICADCDVIFISCDTNFISFYVCFLNDNVGEL